MNGQFKAWLSDSTTDMATRYNTATNHPDVNYVLMNRNVIADSFSDLIDGTIAYRIDVTERGSSVASGRVWSATTTDGSFFGFATIYTCSDWTSNTGSGHVANSQLSDYAWTDPGTAQDCSALNYLYCFED